MRGDTPPTPPARETCACCTALLRTISGIAHECNYHLWPAHSVDDVNPVEALKEIRRWARDAMYNAPASLQDSLRQPPVQRTEDAAVRRAAIEEAIKAVEAEWSDAYGDPKRDRVVAALRALLPKEKP